MKFVICGLWHVHAEGYYNVANHFGEVIGVYEPNDAWRTAFAEKHGVKELLTPEEVYSSGADAAIVCLATNAHTEMLIGLANAGIDIFTEKVLALTSAECDRIAEAVEGSGVKFAISFPHKANGAIRAMKTLADSGKLGRINYFRFRNVHNGSSANWLPPHFYNARECGGGAMIDLGAHGMYLADWFLGMPIDAKSVFTLACTNEENLKKNADGVEDNAITLLRYQNGAIAVNETGFVSTGCPILLELGGENGRAVYDGGAVRVFENGNAYTLENEENLQAPIELFCQGLPILGCGMTEARHLTALMEMAYRP